MKTVTILPDQHPRQRSAIAHNDALPAASFPKLPPELHLNISSNGLSLDTFHALQLTCRNLFRSYHPSFNQFYPDALLEGLPYKIKARLFDNQFSFASYGGFSQSAEEYSALEIKRKKNAAPWRTETERPAKEHRASISDSAGAQRRAIHKMADVLYSWDAATLARFMVHWEIESTTIEELCDRPGPNNEKRPHIQFRKNRWYKEALDRFRHGLVLRALRRANTSGGEGDIEYLEILLKDFAPDSYRNDEKYRMQKKNRVEAAIELGRSRSMDIINIFLRHYYSLNEWFPFEGHPLIKACADNDLEFVSFLIDDVNVLYKGHYADPDKQLFHQRAMCAAMKIPITFSPKFDGVSWQEGKDTNQEWEAAFEDLVETMLAIVKFFYQSSRVDWTSLQTHTISAIMNSSTFHSPNCLNTSAPNHIANKYTWLLIERIVDYLMLEAQIIATSKLLDGKDWPIMKWAIIFAVRPTAHPKEKEIAFRIISTMTKIGLFIDWEAAIESPQEQPFFGIDSHLRQLYLADTQADNMSKISSHLASTKRRQNYPPLLTIQERWGDRWEEIERMCKLGQEVYARELAGIDFSDVCPGCGEVHAAGRISGGPEKWEETVYEGEERGKFGEDPYPVSYWE
ncbi:hypothetical protein BJ508DRAFT_335250 [Ascobolus immersus RN42]|uniref:Uncharacterized protein n=1 Tax=Ascobolus immersus RN42 TaxID=1160509 RepID=A0A3N4HD06_ASCIM|nr:hypothetical protein BJ508DRAFT_335250 [Ascobolus immersus RN42]